jgi:phage tail-like protein
MPRRTGFQIGTLVVYFGIGCKRRCIILLQNDPYPAFNFEVVITGISDDGKSAKGSFSEVSGLEVDVSVIEYRNGSDNNTVRKLPGLSKFTNVTLKRGVIGDLIFWNWLVRAMHGDVQRTVVLISLLDENRSPVMVWKLTRAWPCKWAGPGLNAKNSEIAMETLEICHEGLSVEDL